MPGVGVIGIGSRYSTFKETPSVGVTRASALPATARTLNRTLALLPSAQEAGKVLRASLASLSSAAVVDGRQERRGFQKQLIASMQTGLVEPPDEASPEYQKSAGIFEMVSSLDRSFQKAFRADASSSPDKSTTFKGSNKRTSDKSGYYLFVSEYSQKQDKRSTGKGNDDFYPLASEAWSEMSPAEQQSYQRIAARMNPLQSPDQDLMPPPAPRQTMIMTEEATTQQTSSRFTALQVVSDSEDGVASAATEETDTDLDTQLVKMDFWANLLEAVHLQVSARTTTVWGKKKTYEVYQLAGPAMPVSNLEDIRRRVQQEFLAIYDGSVLSSDIRHVRYSECRVYATLRSNPVALWIQINVGRSLDVADEVNRSVAGGKKKKAATEFVALVTPESPFVVLTASRAASKSPFTTHVLSALEACLTCSVAGGYASKDDDSQRVDELTGTEPFALLKEARAIESRNAVGRFARYAAAGKAQDPIAELQSAATASLLSRESDKAKLQVGAHHGREIANLSAQVEAESNGASALVAANKSGTIVDHSARQAANRKRDRDDAFGNTKDCPVRTHVRWDWKGQTSAAAASWLDEDSSQESDLPEHTFKCRLALQGADVFKGLRALVEAGLMEAPLPDYIKDAPSMGATICVDHGAIVSKKKDGEPKE